MVESHGHTTCDGVLKLYKNGELIAIQNYLAEHYINETSEIKEAYKNGSQDFTEPSNITQFERQWDSLKRIKNYYPTRYHTQPDDKDVILFYKYN